MGNNHNIFVLLIMILSTAGIKGLLNGTVSVTELHEYKKQHCSLSNGFEKQFKCAFMIVNGSQNTVEKQCMLEAFYRDSYSSIILIRFSELILQNVREKLYEVHCNTFILYIHDLNVLSLLFSNLKGALRFYPFSNIFLVFGVITNTNHTVMKPDLSSFLRTDLEYISRISLNVVFMQYSDMIERPNKIAMTRVMTGDKFFVESNKPHSFRKSGWTESVKIFDEDKLIDGLIENKHGLITFTVSLFECRPYIYYIKDENNASKYIFVSLDKKLSFLIALFLVSDTMVLSSGF